jgi:hypothetical protein
MRQINNLFMQITYQTKSRQKQRKSEKTSPRTHRAQQTKDNPLTWIRQREGHLNNDPSSLHLVHMSLIFRWWTPDSVCGTLAQLHPPAWHNPFKFLSVLIQRAWNHLEAALCLGTNSSEPGLLLILPNHLSDSLGICIRLSALAFSKTSLNCIATSTLP